MRYFHINTPQLAAGALFDFSWKQPSFGAHLLDIFLDSFCDKPDSASHMQMKL